MNEHLTLMCDLDGVLADFDGRVMQINEGIACADLPRGRLWASIGHYDKTVGPFFESLDKMSEADTLWKFITDNFVNVSILTACGYTPRDGAEQKKRWVAANFGPSVVTKVVTGSRDKAQFATPTTILIDDRSKSIDPWVEAGGIGILHRSVASTIEELKRIIAEHVV